ncbi:MAG: peptidoglycan-binding protein [Acidimicrobiales bacterium]|nr:peptidoglycan-binding protein [Acidimicrobiales bacterium]
MGRLGRLGRMALCASLAALVAGSCGGNPLETQTEVAGIVVFPTPVPVPDSVPTEVDPFDPESVTQWQQVLVALGYDVVPDGVFGQQTIDATAALQADLGLPATGFVDAATVFAVSFEWPPEVDETSASGATVGEVDSTPTPEPTAVENLLPTPDEGSDIALGCADISSAALPQRAEFLVSVANPTRAREFGIDYGDASQYLTTEWQDAQLNGYVHHYSYSGKFTVTAWVRWEDDTTSTARCVFEIRRGEPAATSQDDDPVAEQDGEPATVAEPDTSTDQTAVPPADDTAGNPDGELPTGPAN